MKLFWSLIFMSVSLYSHPYSPISVDKQIIDFSFNEDFDKAKTLSREKIRENPDSPKYYYYYINAKILEYGKNVRELNSENREEGRKKLNGELVDYCEMVIDKFSASKFNTEDKFYYGAVYGYLARTYGLDGSWWSAFTAGKKAKSIMEEIVNADPKFYDAYLLLGMLEYYSDRLSGITGFVAGVLGFSGDRDKGLRYLNLAYEKGNITFGQSALTLIEVYAHLEDNEAASLKYYQKFLERFPKNKRILNAYCSELMNLWDFKSVESIINNDQNNLVEDYIKARYYHTKGQHTNAIKFAEKTLLNENNLWRGVIEYTRYIIVLNNWLLGNRNQVSKYESTLNDNFSEAFSTTKKYEAESRWLSIFTAEITGDKSVSEIESILTSKPDFKNIAKLEAQYNLLLGSYYLRNNLLNMAESAFYTCINIESSETHYQAFKGLIDIYTSKKVDKSKVKKIIELIDDFDNDRLIYRSKDLAKKYSL